MGKQFGAHWLKSWFLSLGCRLVKLPKPWLIRETKIMMASYVSISGINWDKTCASKVLLSHPVFFFFFDIDMKLAFFISFSFLVGILATSSITEESERGEVRRWWLLISFLISDLNFYFRRTSSFYGSLFCSSLCLFSDCNDSDTTAPFPLLGCHKIYLQKHLCI